MSDSLAAIILAAGRGKRMRSKLPKVLHPVCEVPLVAHVVRLALSRGCSPVVVVIDPQGVRTRELLTALFPQSPLVFAVQKEQRGTGDAARAGLDAIPDFRGNILLLAADVPLLRSKTLGRLEKKAKDASAVVLTTRVADPTGYGRIVRDGKIVKRIVEHADASKEERGINEINSGVYLFDSALLRQAVLSLNASNAQGEFYLTDVVEMAARDGLAAAVETADSDECRGVNTRAQLAEAESALRRRLIGAWQDKGVTFVDPTNTFVGMDVKIGKDATIGVGVQLWGQTKIGAGAVIHGPSVIRDSEVGSDTEIHSFSHLQGAVVGKTAQIGPYARLRPEAKLSDGVKVGNFVEIKKSQLGQGAKVSHLSYVGDASVGAGSNVGAGTITCNYDGQSKHRTVLGEGVFVGSNTTLVAPVTLGRGAYVAAGSTVTKEVPADALAFGRSRQVNREGYAESMRQRQKTDAPKK
ncbi:MAG: bifunctional UDP-N-acetylglucosamine diphosphorylase/glucosamine-1-phosphate N-acetyltransferase GlmU [Myxococcota bacterium]|nr:bifunctional UDP-N-acetylglucosamine diphosphorylase/glucosamine-1-phosphate N-acetyltransferase GlmU [Myxococcota bacterium]